MSHPWKRLDLRAVLRRAATLVVLLAGAATTLATSAVHDPQLEATGSMDAEPGQVPHVRVTLSASAAAVTDHVRIEVLVGSDDGPLEGVSFVADDPRLALGEPLERGRLLLEVEGIRALCPAEIDCVIGLSVSAGDSRAFRVEATATLTRFADRSFPIAENRDFPDDATVTVAIE